MQLKREREARHRLEQENQLLREQQHPEDVQQEGRDDIFDLCWTLFWTRVSIGDFGELLKQSVLHLNWRADYELQAKLGYTLLGAGIMALGIIIGQVITPDIEAQSNGVFDEVKCRRLTVVDEAGEHEIILKQRSINIFNKEGQVAIRLESEDDGKHGIWIVDPLTKKYGIILQLITSIL